MYRSRECATHFTLKTNKSQTLTTTTTTTTTTTAFDDNICSAIVRIDLKHFKMRRFHNQ